MQKAIKGEINIKNNFKDSTILRPLIYCDDKLQQVTYSANRLPISLTIAENKFMPIHCPDLTEIICINFKKIKSTIECVGLK